MSDVEQPRLFVGEGEQLLLGEDDFQLAMASGDALVDDVITSGSADPGLDGVTRWIDKSAIRPRLSPDQARLLDAYRETRTTQIPGFETVPMDIRDFPDAIDGALVSRESWQLSEDGCDDEWPAYAIRHNRHLRLDVCERCPLWDAEHCRASPDEPTEIAGWPRERVWVPEHCPHGVSDEFQSRSEALSLLIGKYITGWGGRASRSRTVEAIHYRAKARGVDLSFAEIQSVFVEALASSNGRWQFNNVFRAAETDVEGRRLSLDQADAMVDAIGSADQRDGGLSEARLRQMLLSNLEPYPVPTPDEELELMRRIEAGDENAFEEMWIRNLRLAFDRAKRRSNIAGSEFLDRLSAAMIALKRAIEKFDPERGFKFSTYATSWIKQSISRQFENEDRLVRLPVHVGQPAYSAVVRASMGIGDFEDVVDALLEVCGNDLDEARKVAHFAMDDEIRVGDISEFDRLSEVRGDDDEVIEEVHQRLLAQSVEYELEKLPKRDRTVLERRFGLDGRPPQTLEEVGSNFGVTRERIRQIEGRILKALESSDSLRGASSEVFSGVLRMTPAASPPVRNQSRTSASASPLRIEKRTGSRGERMISEVRAFAATGERPVWYAYLAMIIDATPSRKGIADGLGLSSAEVDGLLHVLAEVHGLGMSLKEIRRVLGRAAT